MNIVASLLIPFAHGFTVSAAVLVFLSVLNVAPQLAYVTTTQRSISFYGYALCAGVVTFCVMNLMEARLLTGVAGTAVFVVLMAFVGMFVGVLLSALAEVFDILPSFTGKFGIKGAVRILIVALALGKAAGALLYWYTPWFK